MKVIAINGSPHPNGVIAAGIKLIADELAASGIETEVINAGHLEIQGCLDCGGCRTKRTCVISGDIVNETREKIKAADGLIISSPVYYGAIAGTIKCFLDRLFFPGLSLRNKAAVTLASCRRSGGAVTVQQLANYLNLTEAVIVPGIYWNLIHGNNAEQFQEDREGICICKTLGRNMAWLMQALQKGQAEITPPGDVPREWTNFVRE